MDLALALGMPVGLLSRAMTEREFARWIVYARKRKLPQARVELYLAQICHVVASAMGVKDSSLSDYILDFDTSDRAVKARKDAPIEDDDDIDVDEVRAAFQFKPTAKVVKNGP